MRAEDLSTKRATAAAYVASGSGRLILTLVAVAAVVRLLLGGWSWVDALLVGINLTLIGIVEWVIHLFLLHAPLESRRTRVLKTGVGHREHHLDPGNIGWLMLGPVEVAVFGAMIALGTAVWTSALALLAGAAVAPTVASGILLAYLLLGHYEWTHLLVHTRYRPRSRYYRRLARNHRLHHFRNERYWLGVTSNLGDRLLGSYPASRSAVPLSETARSLG